MYFKNISHLTPRKTKLFYTDQNYPKLTVITLAELCEIYGAFVKFITIFTILGTKRLNYINEPDQGRQSRGGGTVPRWRGRICTCPPKRYTIMFCKG